MDLNILTLFSLRCRDYVSSPKIWVSLYLFWPIDFVVNKSHSSFFFWHLGCLLFYGGRYLSSKRFDYPMPAKLETHVGEWFRLCQIFWAICVSDAILNLLDKSICQVNVSKWPQLTLQDTEESPSRALSKFLKQKISHIW